jgi:chemotaxis protein methyltransferase CheR
MNAALAPRKMSELAVEGEYAFTHRNFVMIANLLRERSGIHLSEGKVNLVYSRLAKRLRKLGLESFDAYCVFVESEAGAGERDEMIAALTTNVTRFFREPHHFDHLREKVLERVIADARRGARVRFWSSACSSGEEPYSIALTLLDLFPDAAKHDIRILATDIDPNVLAKARAGIYRNEAVAPIPPKLRDRWMTRQDDGLGWSVKSEVQNLITFNSLNLIGPWPMRGPFEVIFCRNVVIYFESATQTEIWQRFRGLLAPQGRLYVGHSERVDGDEFRSDGLTVYALARGKRS